MSIRSRQEGKKRIKLSGNVSNAVGTLEKVLRFSPSIRKKGAAEKVLI